MKQDSPVSVSVIIPCRNEISFIGDCLDSVLRQDYPNIMEVLVVDGMSNDGTSSLVSAYAKNNSRVRLLINKWKVVPHAMNIGVEAANGDIVIRLDAHSKYPVSYVRRCVAGLLESHADNYGGVFVNIPRGNSRMARVIAALTNHPFGVGNASFRHKQTKCEVDTVPFGCYHRHIFKQIGLYDERLVRNQDIELNARILDKGGRIVLDPSIEIGYYNQSDLSGLLRQARRTGSWNSITVHLCPYSFRWRHQIPGLFALGVLGLVPLAGISFLFRCLLLAGIVLLPFLVYSALAVWAAIECSRLWGWGIGIHIPWVGFLYHFHYGLGCMWGWILIMTGIYKQHLPLPRRTNPA